MILSIDPGKVTGVAFMLPSGVVSTREIEGRYDLCHWVIDHHSQLCIDALVCEDFVISQRTIKTTPQKDPLRIIGWLDIWCEKKDVEFVLQTAAQAKSFATDAKLRHLGWFTSEGEGHANDASRHLLVYLVRTDPKRVAELMEGFDLS